MAERSPLRSIASNASYLAVATVGSRVLSFALAIALARGLGPTEYGTYALAFAILSIVTPLAELGLTPYLIREVARDRAAADAALSRMLALRLASAGVVAAAVIALLALEPDSQLVRALAVLYLAVTFESLAYLGFAYLQGLERMRFESAATLSAMALRAGGGVALVLLTERLLLVLAWMALVSLAQLAVTAARLRREGAGRRADGARPRPVRAILGSAGAMMLVVFFNAVILRADSVVIGAVESAREVGFYTAAYALVTGVQAIPFILAVAVYPVLARTFRRDEAAFRASWSFGTRVAVLATLPAALVATTLAGPVIARVYGAGYAPAADVLAVLMWWIPLAALSALGGGLLRAADRERALALIVGVGAGCNVGGNLIAVPLAGLVGAAAVTVAVEGAMLAAILVVARGLGVAWPATGFAVRTVPAAIGLCAAALALRSVPVEVAIAAACVAYALLLVAFGAVSRGELRSIGRALRPAVR